MTQGKQQALYGLARGPHLALAAAFSEARVYRFSLYRDADPLGRGTVTWILLNPSTADELQDDPTIRRCISFARRWGFRDTEIVNLFAFRATDPEDMKAADDPVGEGNDAAILLHASEADRVVCGWGDHGSYRGRARHVRDLLGDYDLTALKINASGEPKHPLYVAGDTRLLDFG